MERPSFFVITGGMGFGKTTLARFLSRDDQFQHSEELAAELIEEQLRTGGDVLPWTDRYGFEEQLLQRRIEEFESVRSDSVCFFDRGIPEAIAFLRAEEREVPEPFFAASKRFRYNRRVFFLPSWPEIYQQTETRPQLFSEAELVGQCLEQMYRELEYEIVEVPRGDVEERARFVIDKLEDAQPENVNGTEQGQSEKL